MEQKELKTIEFAVKWWSEKLPDEDSEIFKKYLDKAKEIIWSNNGVPDYIKNIIYEAFKSRAKEKFIVAKDKVKPFERVLAEKIKEELQKNKVSILMTDPNGCSCNVLAWAAEKCGINHDDKSIFAFMGDVTMHVCDTKVEVCENQKYYKTCFDSTLQNEKIK